jgi:hypothetical protein
MKKAQIVTHLGKKLTVTIDREDENTIEGTDKYGEPVKLLKKNIAERLPYDR